MKERAGGPALQFNLGRELAVAVEAATRVPEVGVARTGTRALVRWVSTAEVAALGLALQPGVSSVVALPLDVGRCAESHAHRPVARPQRGSERRRVDAGQN